MGCGESKIKNINLPPEPDPLNDLQLQNGGTQKPIEMTKTLIESPKNGEIPSISKLNEDEGLPNRLLSAIPISDLGESLDSRHLSESFNAAAGLGPNSKFNNNNNTNSVDSSDSGYDEYEEDYSHIITEHSDQELVKKVESEFRAVDLPELLVITGRACTRILSGYQKNKAEETKILESLRDEGLLAKPKGKTAGGVSFEVVDANILENNTEENASKDAFISSEFIPSKTLKKLESRRGTIKRPTLKLEMKLAEAEVRRKELEEEKVKTVLERSGLERHGRMRSASAYRREQAYSATVAKRQQQLQEMRDRLKEKHKKNDMIKLKKQLQFSGSGSGSGMDSGFKMEGIMATGAANTDFFDD